MSTGVPYFPVTLPAGTVLGRRDTDTGPAEAIDFATLAAEIGAAAVGPQGKVGAGYGGVSATSLVTAGSGQKTLTITPAPSSTFVGFAYQEGDRVRLTSRDTGAWMEGIVDTFTQSTGVMVVTMVLNSGTSTNADWDIGIAGNPGAVTGNPIDAAETSIASGASAAIGGAATWRVLLTGTTTTTFASSANKFRVVRFEGIVTLTHHDTTLVLPGGVDYTSAAGDIGIFMSDGSGNWRMVSIIRRDGGVLGTEYKNNLASAGTTNLGSVRANAILITGTTTITSFGSSAPTGAIKALSFSGNLQITRNATSMIVPGTANLAVRAGDTMIVRHEGSGNWRIIAWSRNEGRPLTTGTSEKIAVGHQHVAFDIGGGSPLTTGQHQLSIANGRYQTATLHTTSGAVEFLAPNDAESGEITLEIINSSSVTAPTFTGFTKLYTSDTFSTSVNKVHRFYIEKIGSRITYMRKVVV